MRVYATKEELKSEIKEAYIKYIAAFDSIPEQMKDLRAEGVDRTPAENLAYQVGWTTLLLKWERDERCGRRVKTPSEQFRWNQLGALYQWFTDCYAGRSIHELRSLLEKNVEAICAMIDTMSDEELFGVHQRKWADEATKTAVWAVYRFIHINTVAPFGTFLTKIRKWKRLML